MILAGLLGGAAKGIGRDLGMGFGVTERDQDYFDRTRETLRRQYGDDRATLYEQQTAAQMLGRDGRLRANLSPQF